MQWTALPLARQCGTKRDMPGALTDVAFGTKRRSPRAARADLGCRPEGGSPLGPADLSRSCQSAFQSGGPGQLRSRSSRDVTNAIEAIPSSEPSPIGPAIDPTVELAHCFLRLANRSRC